MHRLHAAVEGLKTGAVLLFGGCCQRCYRLVQSSFEAGDDIHGVKVMVGDIVQVRGYAWHVGSAKGIAEKGLP